MNVHEHTCTHMPSQHMSSRMLHRHLSTCSHMCVHVQAHESCLWMYVRGHTHNCECVCSWTCFHIHKHVCVCVFMHIHMDAYVYERERERESRCMYTQSHTITYVLMHKHIQNYICKYGVDLLILSGKQEHF